MSLTHTPSRRRAARSGAAQGSSLGVLRHQRVVVLLEQHLDEREHVVLDVHLDVAAVVRPVGAGVPGRRRGAGFLLRRRALAVWVALPG